MPIVLITGLPGHGKGVFSLDMVEALRIKSNRPVYYHNIKDLVLQWHELKEAKDWINCPEGSIIVLDEAWQSFPLRPNTQIPPEHVGMLAVHRHKGFDLFIITQQPSQIDTFVRRLIDTHYHIVRIFGSQKANVHKFVGLNVNPQLSRKGSIKTVYKYPKKVYEWYKSAEVHTVQTNRPFRIYMLWFGVPLLLAAAVYGAVRVLNPSSGAVSVHAQDSMKSLGANGEILPNKSFSASSVKPDLNYVQAHLAVVPDFPHTAPIYEDIVKPKSAPYPDACASSIKRGCKCYTQQGTAMIVSESTCNQIVKTGFFVEWQETDIPLSNKQVSSNLSSDNVNYLEPTRIDDNSLDVSPDGINF